MSEQIELIVQLTQQAVKGVFQNMVSMEVSDEASSPLAQDPQGEIMGSVGFIGVATGVIYVHTRISFARVITSRMLGIPEPEVEPGDMLSDAIGELSNMVVGNVKSKLCDAGFPCTLSIPSVVRGQGLKVQGASQATRKIIGFGNGQNHLLVEVLLKNTNGS